MIDYVSWYVCPLRARAEQTTLRSDPRGRSMNPLQSPRVTHVIQGNKLVEIHRYVEDTTAK